MRLLGKPQYFLVRLDADMAPEGPLRGGRWPIAKGLVSWYHERVLTYHYVGEPLRRGARVCVNDGRYEGCFGTVIGKSRYYRGYTYGVRRARRKSVTMMVEVEKTTEFEVA